MSGLEALLTGRLLADRYRIEEVIGRGGMGAVYRATDQRLGRQVALKVITVGGLGDQEARERLRQRFLREARAAAGLPHHPNVVPVYDYGTDGELGLDFLVMELLRGEDLASLLARAGSPPLSAAIRILHEASRGIAVGHRAGLIHRDVKPGNIFLAQGDHRDEIEVRVLDFGIAKLADDDTLTQLTQDGRVPLSPAYASPEQLRGLSRITPASDVFSLGAVGYQLLCGERPFSDADRNRMSLNMPVPPPSLRERNPAVPPAIEEVVLKALAHEPAERFADAHTFSSVLEQARREIGDAPLPPYRDSAATARPAAVEATAPMPPVPHAEDRTELLETDDRTLLDPAVAADSRAADAASPQQAAPRPTPVPPRRAERGARGAGWLLVALILFLLLGAGAVFAWWTLTEPQRVTFVPAAPPEVPAIEPEPVEEEPQPEIQALNDHYEGQRFLRQGDFRSALEHYERAVRLMPGNATYRYNYALTLLRLGDAGGAAREFRRVLTQEPRRADAHYNAAEAYLMLGDTAEAISALESALDFSSEPAQRRQAERRLREVRSAVVQPIDPVDTPEESPPPVDTFFVPPPRAAVS